MQWILRSNPSTYDLARRMKDPAYITNWAVPPNRQKQVRRGDRVFFATCGPDAALYGCGVILSDLVTADESQGELAYAPNPPSDFPGGKKNVFIDITCRFPSPVSMDRVRQVPGLADMEVFGPFQATSFFPVSDEEAALLADFLCVPHRSCSP